MTSLRLPDRLEETVRRIEALQADSARAWGKMTLPQMLVHCQRPLETAAGELKLKRALIGFLFGKIAKKKFITADTPFGRNSPTDPRFLSAETNGLERERARLLELVKGYCEHGPRTSDPHPFFGPLTEEEWDRLMWKHLDHHLRQFGA
jgi:hypothetical protein